MKQGSFVKEHFVNCHRTWYTTWLAQMTCNAPHAGCNSWHGRLMTRRYMWHDPSCGNTTTRWPDTGFMCVFLLRAKISLLKWPLFRNCWPYFDRTLQWTWVIALLTFLQDVICLLPHATQWSLPLKRARRTPCWTWFACLHDLNPFHRVKDTTGSTTGADWMRPAPRVPENRLHRIGTATSRLQAALSFFFTRVSPCDPMYCSLSFTVC